MNGKIRIIGIGMLIGMLLGGCGGDAPGIADAGPVACPGMGEQVFAEGVLHRIDITVSEANWAALVDQAEQYAEDEETEQTYFEASVEYDDLPKLDGVGIRIKGNHSVQNAVELGKSLPLKVDIDRFADDQLLDGLKKLNLHAVVDEEEGWEWPSDPVADYVSYKAMRAHGEPTSRVAFAEVFVNGESQGLFSVVEQISGTFVKCNWPEPWGDLYKPGESLEYEGDSIDDYPDIELKWPDADETDQAAVVEMIRVLEQGSNAELEQVLDIDGALKYFALNIGLGNWDYYTFITHNYYLYEAEPGKFTVVPWDFNMSQVDWELPCGMGTGDEETPLSFRLLGDPDYLERYKQLLEEFLEGAGSVESQLAFVDEAEPLVGEWISSARLNELRANIETRVSGMLDALDGLDECADWTDWDEY